MQGCLGAADGVHTIKTEKALLEGLVCNKDDRTCDRKTGPKPSSQVFLQAGEDCDAGWGAGGPVYTQNQQLMME